MLTLIFKAPCCSAASYFRYCISPSASPWRLKSAAALATHSPWWVVGSLGAGSLSKGLPREPSACANAKSNHLESAAWTLNALFCIYNSVGLQLSAAGFYVICHEIVQDTKSSPWWIRKEQSRILKIERPGICFIFASVGFFYLGFSHSSFPLQAMFSIFSEGICPSSSGDNFKLPDGG